MGDSVYWALHKLLCLHCLRPPATGVATAVAAHSPHSHPNSPGGNLLLYGEPLPPVVWGPVAPSSGHCRARKLRAPGHGEKDRNRRCSKPRTQRPPGDFSNFSSGKKKCPFGCVARLVRYELEATNGHLAITGEEKAKQRLALLRDKETAPHRHHPPELGSSRTPGFLAT